jgi:hypothetical protein
MRYLNDAIRRPKIIAKWNLPLLAAKLAAHLEALKRADKLIDTASQTDDFLEPYALSPDDDYTVSMRAWGKQCVDCGDVEDYYMVHNRVWKKAGLKPNQCCCCRCLAVRLGRPLKYEDFIHIWPKPRPESSYPPRNGVGEPQ